MLFVRVRLLHTRTCLATVLWVGVTKTRGARRAPGRVAGARPPHGARTRILETAYELFSRNGIHAVGVDRIIADAGVAKATLYHHFPSKEALVIAFLDLREERWTRDWLQAEVERRAAGGQERVLAVFDAFDEWFHRPDYECCAFINTLLEIGDEESPIHREAVRHLTVVLEILEGYAEQDGAADPKATGRQLQLLVMGAIVSARRGDREAARRARDLAEVLLDRSR
jgi:AcrR family transcriptional regulator